MAQRATSLGPKPSLLLFFLFFCFFFVWGGLKGQVRWPKGPPHLALIFFLLCHFFPFLHVKATKKTCFPSRKGHFCLIFSLSFSSVFFPPPFFLSLSLSCSFLSSFLFFFFAFVSLFLSLSFLFFLLVFCFMKRRTLVNHNRRFFCSFFEIPLPYLCFFSVF